MPQQFCCTGCRTAYGIIHSCGLEKYYEILNRENAAASPRAEAAREFAEFDDPAFSALYCRPCSGGRSTTEWFLTGIHCAACIWLLEKLPRMVPGVAEARVDIARETIAVTWDPSAVRASDIAHVLDSLGYTPHPARDASTEKERKAEERRRLVRLAVAGACAGNVMLLAFALYAGLFDRLEPEYALLFRWTSMGISLVSLLWPGWVFIQSSWTAIRTRTMHLDVPITLGLIAAAVAGVVNTVLNRGEIYFDTLSALIFLLLAGRQLQARQHRKASNALELLFSLTPTSARRLEGDVIRQVPIDSIQPGDRVVVRAGDSIPVDGVVCEGESAVDQSLLSGESRPVAVKIASDVAAGAVNLASQIVIRTVATGLNTRVGRLMQEVQRATSQKPPIVRRADQLSSYFTAGMILLSVATLVIWLVLNPAVALDHASAVLIVTCPCALGLATPLVMTVAIGRSASRGILIKSAEVLERLATPGTIFLDKTGTLTEGAMRLVRFDGPAWLEKYVAALEACSSHPIAVALVRDLPSPEGVKVESVEQVQGGGIRGTVNGMKLAIGSADFVRSRGGDLSKYENTLREMASTGLTSVVVAVDGVAKAALGLGDRVRPEAGEAIEKLRRMGWTVGVLSGDQQRTVDAIARTLNIPMDDARGGVTPEGKLETVKACSGHGPVVMVGDGVNDAAALSAASVGIAVHGGAEASLAAADVYLRKPDLVAVVDLIEGSRRTVRVIRRTLVASVFYNLVAGGLSVVGVIHPLIAAILMPLSSLTVLAMALKWRTFDREVNR
jgi:Cu2+-exporting ATPase